MVLANCLPVFPLLLLFSIWLACVADRTADGCPAIVLRSSFPNLIFKKFLDSTPVFEL